MHESAGYPESSAKFSDELQSKLLNLPEKDLEKCANKVLDILWFQENIWKETVEFEIPQDQVICGMQANIFKIILKVLSMFFYPDFITILPCFYPDFITILSYFYPDFIQIRIKFG